MTAFAWECIRDVGKFGWWGVFCPLLLATSSLPLTLSGITEKEKQNNKKEMIIKNQLKLKKERFKEDNIHLRLIWIRKRD